MTEKETLCAKHEKEKSALFVRSLEAVSKSVDETCPVCIKLGTILPHEAELIVQSRREKKQSDFIERRTLVFKQAMRDLRQRVDWADKECTFIQIQESDRNCVDFVAQQMAELGFTVLSPGIVGEHFLIAIGW